MDAEEPLSPEETMDAEEWRWLQEGWPQEGDEILNCPRCEQPIHVGDLISVIEDDEGNPVEVFHGVCPTDPWDDDDYEPGPEDLEDA